MSFQHATPVAAQVATWENEGGAPTSAPDHDQTPAQNGEWRNLLILGAVIAVWPDLTTGVRRRIAADTVIAMAGTSNDHAPGA